MIDKIKSLSKQTLIYGTSTIVGRFLNFILVPFYTNVFAPSEYGIFSVIFAYIAFLNIFFSLGLESGYFKFASTLEVGNEKQNFSTPFILIFVNSLILSVIIYSLAPVLAPLLSSSKDYTEIVHYSAMILFFDAVSLVPFAYLRLKNKPKVFAFIKVVNIIINVSLNFILVLKFKMGVPAVFISNVAASLITFILLSKYVFENLSIKFDKKLINELFRFSLPYIPAGMASILVQVVSRPIMMLLTDEANVGIFQANFRLGIFMMLLVSMFEYAWRPFFLNHAKEADAKEIFSKVMTLFVGSTSVILILLTFFIPDLIKIPLPFKGHLIGAKYWSGVYIVPIVLYAYLIYGMYINLMAGIYIEKKTKYLPAITGLGAVINIGGNFLLIPLLGIFGAAIATFLSYLSMTIYIYLKSQKFYPINYERMKLIYLHLICIVVLAIYYISYYFTFDLSLIARIIITIVTISFILIISGISKVKKHLF